MWVRMGVHGYIFMLIFSICFKKGWLFDSKLTREMSSPYLNKGIILKFLDKGDAIPPQFEHGWYSQTTPKQHAFPVTLLSDCQ